MSKTCKNCGKKVADNAKFCTECGGHYFDGEQTGYGQAPNMNNPFYGQPQNMNSDPFSPPVQGFNSGNVGVFNPQQQVKPPKKKNGAVAIVLIAVVAVIGVMIGIFAIMGGGYEPQEFSAGGITLTLTSEFEAIETDNYEFAYSTYDIMVLGLREYFSDYDGLEDVTLDEYVEAAMTTTISDLSDVATEKRAGAVYFNYEYNDGTDDYIYHTYVYKTDDSFVILQFVAFVDNQQELLENIDSWLASAKF